MRKYGKCLAAAAAAALMMTAMTVCAGAQEVTITGEPCPLTFVTDRAQYEALLAEAGEAGLPENLQDAAEETAEAAAEETAEAADGEAAETAEAEAAESGSDLPYVTVLVDHLNVLGVLDDAYAAALFDDQKVLIPLQEILERLPAVNVDALGSAVNWTDLGRGSSGELAKKVQENLISLSFLNGEADGVFGGMTAEAVAAFQSAEGLEPTGQVDAFSFFLLDELAAGEVEVLETVYPPVYKAEDKFASIIDSVRDTSVLEAYLDPEWKFSYDVFEGIGSIKRGQQLGFYEDTGRPIDRIRMDVSEEVYVARNTAGEVDVIPAIIVSSYGAYRPYVQKVLVRSGNRIAELETLVKTGRLDGTNVAETAVVPLTEEAEAILAEDSVVIRVEGPVHTYEIEAE